MSKIKYQMRIEVLCRFLPEQSDTEQGRFSYAYTVRIQNTGTVAAQLISRHWIITDENGGRVEVKGLGVVGHQPLLQPGENFEYTSGSQIVTPVGTMEGSFFFVAEDGQRFDAPIPMHRPPNTQGDERQNAKRFEIDHPHRTVTPKCSQSYSGHARQSIDSAARAIVGGICIALMLLADCAFS
jgi:ApaG protein